MKQQEYQDKLKEQAMLFYQTDKHPAYLDGWLASQCVQMYELLSSAQQQAFADKLLFSMQQIEAEINGESLPNTSTQTQ